MGPFLDDLAIHLMAIHARAPRAPSQMALYTRTRLQHSPPFVDCPAGFIRDLHECEDYGPLVSCVQSEALLETLTDILIGCGTTFVENIGPRRKRREFDHAKVTMRQALAVFYPENRNKKLWRQYQAVMNALQRISGDDYMRLEKHQRELLKQWRHRFAHLMKEAFYTFGPPQAVYPHEAVYIAIASIYNNLSIEGGQLRNLADRIRKRCEAHHTLE